MVFSTAAWADPIATPYWEFDYTIDDSYIWVNAPIIGIQTALLGSNDPVGSTGSMVLHRGSLDDDGGAAGLQSDARLAALHIIADYNLSDVITMMDINMEGDANGRFDSSIQQVTWDASPAGDLESWHQVGTITCQAGAFICGFAGLPNAIPVKVDSTVDITNHTDMIFNAGAPYMVIPTLPDPPTEYRIIGVVNTKTCIGGDTGTGNECLAIVPEPTSGLLVGLGVLGVALVRYRRR
jgi:hypothetical protein